MWKFGYYKAIKQSVREKPENFALKFKLNMERGKLAGDEPLKSEKRAYLAQKALVMKLHGMAIHCKH